MTCGVYSIKCSTSGRLYVGSAVNVERRWTWHRSALRRGRHHSPALQAAWDLHGEACFSFEVIEEVDRDLLLIHEQKWIDELDVVKNGYNCFPKATGSSGWKHREDTKQKQSASAKVVALAEGESARRSERAKRQHAEGKLGRQTWKVS